MSTVVNSTTGCMIVVVLCILFILCPMAFDYSLWVYFGKDIPWYGDLPCGVLLSGIVVPAAIIAWVLVMCDCEPPLLVGAQS